MFARVGLGVGLGLIAMHDLLALPFSLRLLPERSGMI